MGNAGDTESYIKDKKHLGTKKQKTKKHVLNMTSITERASSDSLFAKRVEGFNRASKSRLTPNIQRAPTGHNRYRF